MCPKLGLSGFAEAGLQGLLGLMGEASHRGGGPLHDELYHNWPGKHTKHKACVQPVMVFNTSPECLRLGPQVQNF